MKILSEIDSMGFLMFEKFEVQSKFSVLQSVLFIFLTEFVLVPAGNVKFTV